MMNTMVVRKLLDGFKHMTYKIAQQIEPMSTFRNLVRHEFKIITRMLGPRFKSYNVHRIETLILSLVLCTFKCYILPVSVNLPLLTTLGSYRFPTHVHSFSPCFDLLVSQLRNPFFHSVTKCIYLTHPPLHPMPSSLSLPLSLSPSRAKYMHCLSSPPSLSRARTHVVYLGHSLETVSLFLPHGGPHSLNLTLFI